MSITDAMIDDLCSACDRERILTSRAECWVYGNDNSRLHAPPDAVVFPQSHDEVLAIVRVCRRHHIPVTPRGRGTGTTGAATAPLGGVMISFEKMNRILDLNIADRTLRVQPGLINREVQTYCEPHGLFWPPDPGSSAYCSIGGNLACNAAGPHTLKYGSTRDNTLQLKAVSGAGEALVCGAITSKSVVGLDLVRLLVGSEGILAVITEAVLKLSVIPEKRTVLRVDYASVASAVDAICAIMSQSQMVCALELMDDVCVELLRKYSNQILSPQTQAVLIIEIDGGWSAVDEAVQAVRRISEDYNPVALKTADDVDSVADLWAARKDLSPTLRNHKPFKVSEDVVVPISELTAFVSGIQKIAAKYRVCIANFGHAGNGNLHVNVLYDAGQEESAQKAIEEVFALAISKQGSISGEHGIGLNKLDFVALEIDPDTLNIMRRIKQVFDPDNILNGNKTLPL